MQFRLLPCSSVIKIKTIDNDLCNCKNDNHVIKYIKEYSGVEIKLQLIICMALELD